MPTETLNRFDFRPVAADDLPLIARWLETPHVARWWGDPKEALARIAEHLTTLDTVTPFIILRNKRPIGYVQSYDIHAEDGHPYQDQPAGSLGIDLSIGDPDLVGKGHGPEIIESFVRRLFQKGAPRIVIDPDPDNAIAIRAYEKAGFRPIGRRSSIYGPALLMVRDNDHTSFQ